MNRLIVSLVMAPALFAGEYKATALSGNYVESRTADVYVGACFANSEVSLTGNLAVFGWQVREGRWQGVELGGLSVAAAIRANSTLGDWTNETYPVRAVLLVDERATLEQRQALRAFAKQMAGDLLQDIIREEAMPIAFEVLGGSIHEAKVKLTAGTLARIETRAMQEGDHTCGHEVAWYEPLTKTEHAMPAFTKESGYQGPPKGELGVRWTSVDKRSAYVGTFRYEE